MEKFLIQYQPYLWQLKDLGNQIYRNEYFEYIIIGVTIVISFLVGRLSYQKKLTNLLQMVNDAEATRKSLKGKLEQQEQRFQKIRGKKKIIYVLGIVVILANAAYFYFNKTIQPYMIICTLGPFLLLWILFQLTLRWLKWDKKTTQVRLKNTNQSAEQEIKQILKVLGNGLKNRLKSLYENQIEYQWSKQQKQECKLYKCYNQKRAYEDLYKLYQQIIDQIKKINMCDICLSQNNISVQKLGLNELQNNIKNFKRVKASKMSLAQKKQLVNRLLAQYQKVGQKLPNICKKGCCIKQRVLIQNAKNKYHERLKKTLSMLTQRK